MFEYVWDNALERAFRASARRRPFNQRFDTVQEVVADLEQRGLLNDAARDYVKRIYG